MGIEDKSICASEGIPFSETIKENGAPLLIIVRGIPGAGKSFVSRGLAEKFRAGDTVVIDPDAIDRNGHEYQSFTATLETQEPDLDRTVFPYRYILETAARVLSEHKTVIWNQPFTDLEGLSYTIRKLFRLTEGVQPCFKSLIVDIEIPEDVAWERILKRQSMGGHSLTRERFLQFVRQFGRANLDGVPEIALSGVDKNPDDLFSKVMEFLEK